jgi:subtilisin family serine protease
MKDYSRSTIQGDLAEPARLPSDARFPEQWHLANVSAARGSLNPQRAWDDYVGRGVTIGVVDDGIDYTHNDIAPNYAPTLDVDARDSDSDGFAASAADRHGTAVAGVAAAAWNGTGVVGVASSAQVASLRIGFGSDHSVAQLVTAFQQGAALDVVNNSWGYSGYFVDDLRSPAFVASGDALTNAVQTGRDGLGTVFVFAAGNGAASGDNVNYHGFQNSPNVIAVAAVDRDGYVTSFSTPGAAVLVSAPGQGILTTDRPGGADRPPSSGPGGMLVQSWPLR